MKRVFVDANIVIDLLCERNKKDFRASEIPVYELDDFIALLDNNQ